MVAVRLGRVVQEEWHGRFSKEFGMRNDYPKQYTGGRLRAKRLQILSWSILKRLQHFP
jgi:hypothetical protein